MRRLGVVVLLLALAASACSFDELVDFTAGAGGSDQLTANENEDVQAGGQTADAADDEKTAANHATESFKPDKTDQERLEEMERAVEQRPFDPYYLGLQVVMQQMLIPDYTYVDLTADAASLGYLLNQQHPLPDGGQDQVEVMLRIQLRSIQYWSQQAGSMTATQSGRYARITTNFCNFRDSYQRQYGDTLDGASFVVAMQTNAVTCP